MNQLQKYRRLGSALKEFQWEGSDENEAGFFFRQLERLQIDLLVGQIEVTEQKRQISALQAKIEVIRQEQRCKQKYMKKQTRIIINKTKAVVNSLLKSSSARLRSASGQRFHSLLVHSPAAKWKEGMVFRVSLEQQA